MERRQRRGIHPQMRKGFEMLYEELRAQGLSDQEAHQRLMTDFDWGLNELSKPITGKRLDEYAKTEFDRAFEADAGTDLAAAWLGAAEKGAARFFEKMVGIKRD